VPPEVRGAPEVTGAGALTEIEQDAGGSRVLHVRPLGGAYRVTVAAAPLALRGCA
jgi:hypothetical protein